MDSYSHVYIIFLLDGFILLCHMYHEICLCRTIMIMLINVLHMAGPHAKQTLADKYAWFDML